VYPVMAAFPSSFGGIHVRATFSPQTSSIFTAWGGPGRSVGWIHGITVRLLSTSNLTWLHKDILISLSLCYRGQCSSRPYPRDFWDPLVDSSGARPEPVSHTSQQNQRRFSERKKTA
jgi:hypothetical protein